jgi:hypothetical protein
MRPIAIKAPFTHYAACQLSCLADFVAEQVRQTLLPGEVQRLICSGLFLTVLIFITECPLRKYQMCSLLQEHSVSNTG